MLKARSRKANDQNIHYGIKTLGERILAPGNQLQTMGLPDRKPGSDSVELLEAVSNLV